MAEDKEQPRGAWAPAVERLSVSDVPEGAINLNLEGRVPVSPLQGFGPLWQKSFRIRLRGLDKSPAEVMAIWKAEFPRFQPPGKLYRRSPGSSGQLISSTAPFRRARCCRRSSPAACA